MCLEYSQHFSAFLDAVSMQNLNTNVKFQLNTFDFSQMNLGTMSLVPESPERAAKCTRDADCDYDIVYTSYASSSLTKCLPNAQTKNTIDPYGEDHPTKCTCITLVTNFIRSYLHHFFDDSHGLKASLKPLRRPFDRCQSRLEAINIGRDIKQINW